MEHVIIHLDPLLIRIVFETKNHRKYVVLCLHILVNVGSINQGYFSSLEQTITSLNMVALLA